MASQFGLLQLISNVDGNHNSFNFSSLYNTFHAAMNCPVPAEWPVS